MVTDLPTNTQTNTETHRQGRLQLHCAAASAQCNHLITDNGSIQAPQNQSAQVQGALETEKLQTPERYRQVQAGALGASLYRYYLCTRWLGLK